MTLERVIGTGCVHLDKGMNEWGQIYFMGMRSFNRGQILVSANIKENWYLSPVLRSGHFTWLDI
jgi:hypothetical protein